MAVAVASRGGDWDQWQAHHKVKIRRDPLGMHMRTNGHRSAAKHKRRKGRLALCGDDLAEANKRSRTERSYSRPKERSRLSLPASPIPLVARSRSRVLTRERDSLPCGSASPKRRVVTPPRRASCNKSCTDPDHEESLTQPKPLLVNIANFVRPANPEWSLIWDFRKSAHYLFNWRTHQSQWPQRRG